VSGLKYALRRLGSRMKVDQDVLFLSISSHGADDPAIVVSNSQLPLQDLTDDDLADALRESGIKWRVIIISACYAGGFIDRLRDPQTIVITAAAADRTSFGCSNDRDLTYFGEAFYRDALPGARSLRDAFDTAKAAIAARERDHTRHQRCAISDLRPTQPLSRNSFSPSSVTVTKQHGRASGVEPECTFGKLIALPPVE